MRPNIRLSPDESALLEQILLSQSQRAKRPISLSDLLDKWERFIMKVEEGYRLTIDDYTNSLSIRNLIQQVLDALPDNAGLREWIDQCDKRFANATDVTRMPLLPSLGNEDVDWWWFRIPRKPEGELKRWLQTNGPL